MLLNIILGIILFSFILASLYYQQKKKKEIRSLHHQITLLKDGVFQTLTRQFHLAPTSVIDLLKKTYTTFSPLAEEKNLELNLKINAPEHQVMLDINAFNEVMRQLLNNALMYARTSIELQLTENRDLQQYIITLNDDGSGIAPEEHQLVFKPFYKGKKNYGNEESCGLGLTLVKEYILHMGGALQLKSNLNEGTTFIILFAYEDESER